ncbi:MAG: hypothetical protein IJ086_00075 [Clostridium sp.]|nr:hypothetical protein [Clostridium sp.]
MMNIEKEIAGTIILIVEDEGFFNEKINTFIFNNRYLFNINEYIFKDDLNITSLIKNVVNEIEKEGFLCDINTEGNLTVKCVI